MASSNIIERSLNQGPFHLLVVWTVIFSLTESISTIQLKGEAGGEVIFRCPVDRTRTVTFFYFQRGDVFLNGYHAYKTIPTARSENTRLDDRSTHVHMLGLNIGDAGKYQCIIQYNDSTAINRVYIQLTVTAPYSEPTVTQSCDDVRCLVTCASYNGYPGFEVAWTIPGSSGTNSQRWRVENNTQVPSASTMLVNSTSTVDFNCSSGEMKNVSCSVGNVTSAWFTVCKCPVKTDSNLIIVTTAVCVILSTFLFLVLFLYCRCRRGQRGKDSGAKGTKEELEEFKVEINEGSNQLCEKKKEKDKEDAVADTA